MISIKQADAFLAKHHKYISPFILSLAVILALDLISPTLLLAQELSPPLASPAPDSQYTQYPNTQYLSPPPAGQYPQMPPSGYTGTYPTQSPPPSGTMMPPPPNDGQYPNQQYQPGQPMQPQNFDGGQQGQMGNFGPSEEQMNKEQARHEADRVKQEARSLKQMKSGMRGMEQGIKMFKTQIARLTKQGITVPAEIADNMNKITALITALKSAENFQDAQEQMQELPDLMQSLDEQRQMLEKLGRWKQTLTQADRTIKQLDRSLKQNKTLAARLEKKGYDISDLVSKFESGVQTMKDSRAKAIELIKTDPESAFDEIENNLFEQMDDLMQSDRTIKELGNLSSFNSSFKRGIAEGQSMINKLKRMKIDTTDLAAKLAELKAKATEVNSVIKQKPIDTDSIVGIFEELDSMRRDFENTASELMGDQGADMPWESGPQQFKQIDTKSMNKFIPQKPEPFDPGFSGSGSGPGMNTMAPGTF